MEKKRKEEREFYEALVKAISDTSLKRQRQVEKVIGTYISGVKVRIERGDGHHGKK